MGRREGSEFFCKTYAQRPTPYILFPDPRLLLPVPPCYTVAMKPTGYEAQKLAKIFFEMGYILDMQGVAFKPRAYEMASESLIALGDEVKETWKHGGIKALDQLPGIGASIAEKIDEFYRTGRVKEYEKMKKTFPVDIWSLASIEGVGPKTIKDLYKNLKVKSIKDLEAAIKKHRIQKLKGYGKQSEENIARGIALKKQASGRRLLGDVLPIAEGMVEKLKRVKGVKHCAYAGSLRRRKTTIGDIDIVATTDTPKRIVDAFCSLPEVQSVHERGKHRASVRLAIGMDADILVVPDKVYGAALQHFTGDKRHNVLLRQYALGKGYTLSEYGIFKRGKGKRKGSKLIPCKTEDVIYNKLGLDTPPPEIRIGEDEIEAAEAHSLPKLIPYGSVKGDLQVQTNWTDGRASIANMATAAKKTGLSYMAVTDHTKALAFIHGLDDAGVEKQIRDIKKLNASLKGFRVFTGTECDIHKDGTLDLKDATLAKLEWVGVSVHSAFRLPSKEQTKRIVRAISNPNVDCYFHPFARIIGEREAIEFDFAEVLAAAKKHRVALEIDCYPDRSDLDAQFIREAVKAGVKLAIDTDAHAPEHFDFLPLGEALARRGWAKKSDILNTKNARELEAYLNKKRKRR